MPVALRISPISSPSVPAIPRSGWSRPRRPMMSTLHLSADPWPEQVRFVRSDQYSFRVRAGILQS